MGMAASLWGGDDRADRSRDERYDERCGKRRPKKRNRSCLGALSTDRQWWPIARGIGHSSFNALCFAHLEIFYDPCYFITARPIHLSRGSVSLSGMLFYGGWLARRLRRIC
jgi:hypothetical protein